MNKTRYNFSLSQEALTRLGELAKSHGLTRSAMLETLIRQEGCEISEATAQLLLKRIAELKEKEAKIE